MSLPLFARSSGALRTAPAKARLLLGSFAVIGFLFAVPGTVFSGLLWLVNLDEATAGRIAALHRFAHGALPDQLHRLLQGLSKDASTVTPLIALLLAIALLRSSTLILFRPEKLPRALADSRGHFPFTATYQTTWVQLGLIGTLWAFLLIGNHLKPGIDDPAESVTLLVMAFGTALLSTLAGVVGSYILGPLLSSAFRTRLAAAGVREESTPALLEQLRVGLDALTSRAVETARRLGAQETKEGSAGTPALGVSVSSVSRALGELQGKIEAFELQGFAARLVDESVERMARTQEAAVARLGSEAANRQAATVEALVRGLADLGQGIERGQAELGRGLRDGLVELGALRQAARAEDRKALADRLAELDRQMQAQGRRLEKAIEERPLAFLREVEREGRQAVLDRVAELRRALDSRLDILADQLRRAPQPPPAVGERGTGKRKSSRSLGLRLLLPWRTR